MPTYSVFGLRLASEIDLPEAVGGSQGATSSEAAMPSCVLRHRAEVAPTLPHRLVGEEVVYADLRVRSYQTSEGLRLVYDDTGTFDIRADGSEVIWWGGGLQVSDAVQTDVLGRVLAMALHNQQVLTLHASAVNLDGAGVVFLAPKGYGKSSLAMALLRAGARLISDDTVAIQQGDPPMLRPGVQTLRLRQDAAERYLGTTKPPPADKLHFRPEVARSVGVTNTPLHALYLLHPVAPSPGEPAVTRMRQKPIPATLAVTTFRKLGALLDGQSGQTSFVAAAELAQRVPVYSLMIQRSLDRLDDVAAELMLWHAGA